MTPSSSTRALNLAADALTEIERAEVWCTSYCIPRPAPEARGSPAEAGSSEPSRGCRPSPPRSVTRDASAAIHLRLTSPRGHGAG